MTRSGRRGSCGRPLAVALLAALPGLTACAPEVPGRALAFPFAAGFAGAGTAGRGAPVLMGNTEWWRGFGDPLLDRLIAAALADSLTLEAARARVAQAQAARRAVEDPLQLAGTLSARREGTDGPGGGADRSVTRAEAGLTLLFDPWGRLQHRRRAAEARAAGAEAERDATQLLLIFNMADAYVDLRWRQRILALRLAEAERRRQTLALTRQRQAANAATRLEIARAEARVAEIDAQIPALRAAVTAAQNEIAVLAGAAPGALPPDLARGLHAAGRQPQPALSPEVGIPADLLRNRPDIRAAEQVYLAALADLGAARADLYPRLSLGGTITASRIAGGGRTTDYAIGPSIVLPVLPDGAARATVSAREAAVAEAHALWTERVIGALRDVENALADYRAQSEGLAAAGRAARLYGEARGLTRSLVEAGGATLGELIDAEEEAAAAETALADALNRRARAFVALHVRLGAGHAVAAPGSPGRGIAGQAAAVSGTAAP